MKSPIRTVLVGWIVAVAFVAWREVKTTSSMPKPSAFLGTGIIYGSLSVLAEVLPALAGPLTLAWTLGLAYSAVAARPARPPTPKQPKKQHAPRKHRAGDEQQRHTPAAAGGRAG